LKLSRETEYAILAILDLARHEEGQVMLAAELADELGIPPAFLAKILQKLAAEGVLHSHRGRTRGYSLARSPETLSLRAVLEAVEGPHVCERCVFSGDRCSGDDPCPLHGMWKDVRPVVATLMADVTIADIASGRPIPIALREIAV
jgi:Rrf2 family transcriptional regulator, iron-sulfur cluster assembly transcription factor